MQTPAITLPSFSRGGFYIDSRRMPIKQPPSHHFQGFTVRTFLSCPSKKSEQICVMKRKLSRGKTMSSTFLWEAQT